MYVETVLLRRGHFPAPDRGSRSRCCGWRGGGERVGGSCMSTFGCGFAVVRGKADHGSRVEAYYQRLAAYASARHTHFQTNQMLTFAVQSILHLTIPRYSVHTVSTKIRVLAAVAPSRPRPPPQASTCKAKNTHGRWRRCFSERATRILGVQRNVSGTFAPPGSFKKEFIFRII